MKKFLSKYEDVIDAVAAAVMKYAMLFVGLWFGGIYAMKFAAVPDELIKSVSHNLQTHYGLMAGGYVVAEECVGWLIIHLYGKYRETTQHETV